MVGYEHTTTTLQINKSHNEIKCGVYYLAKGELFIVPVGFIWNEVLYLGVISASAMDFVALVIQY